MKAILALVALSFVAACSQPDQPTERPNVTEAPAPKNVRITEYDKRAAAPYVAAAKWHVIPYSMPNIADVFVTDSANDRRLLVPDGRAGYLVYRIDIDCGRGLVFFNDGARSRADDAIPTGPAPRTPHIDINRSVSAICAGGKSLQQVSGTPQQVVRQQRQGSPASPGR